MADDDYRVKGEQSRRDARPGGRLLGRPDPASRRELPRFGADLRAAVRPRARGRHSVFEEA